MFPCVFPTTSSRQNHQPSRHDTCMPPPPCRTPCQHPATATGWPSQAGRCSRSAAYWTVTRRYLHGFKPASTMSQPANALQTKSQPCPSTPLLLHGCMSSYRSSRSIHKLPQQYSYPLVCLRISPRLRAALLLRSRAFRCCARRPWEVLGGRNAVLSGKAQRLSSGAS